MWWEVLATWQEGSATKIISPKSLGQGFYFTTWSWHPAEAKLERFLCPQAGEMHCVPVTREGIPKHQGDNQL